MDKANLIISIIIVLCIAAAVAAYGITNSDSPVLSELSSMGSTDNNGDGIGNNTTITNTTDETTSSGSSDSGSGNSNNYGPSSQSSGSSSSGSSSNGGSSSSSSSSSGSSSNGQYSDWQKDYETGKYDEDGNPIYRSVASTSGGQNEPGIYESYWSANGPISEERIG